MVGFVARLAPEKSPGLFLMAAAEILQMYPFARFVVIGDGELRTYMEGLARGLDIASAVHFAGCLYIHITCLVYTFLWMRYYRLGGGRLAQHPAGCGCGR